MAWGLGAEASAWSHGAFVSCLAGGVFGFFEVVVGGVEVVYFVGEFGGVQWGFL